MASIISTYSCVIMCLD